MKRKISEIIANCVHILVVMELKQWQGFITFDILLGRVFVPLALHKNINSTGRSGACATMLLLTNNTDRNEKRYMIAICLKKLFQYNANFFKETKTRYVKFYTWFYASTPFSNKTRGKIKDFRTFYLRERCRRIESSIEFPPKNE